MNRHDQAGIRKRRARNAWVPVLALAAILLPGRARAAEDLPPPTNFTVHAALDWALRDNADLKGLRARLDAMRERPAQVGALPNPMFSYSGMDFASGGNWPDTDEKRYMIQQEFPWAGKRGLRRDMAVKDAEIMRYDLESMTREIAMKVKEGYFDLRAIQRVLAITREEEGVLQRVGKVAETLYTAGSRTQVDVLKAQSEITMLKQKLLDLQAQEAALQAGLNTLLNRRADAALPPCVSAPEAESPDPAEDLFVKGASHSPEILAADVQAERAELESRLMAKESIPDYRVGLEYRDMRMDDDLLMVTVSVDLPIWRGKYHAGVREADRMRASSQAAGESARRQNAFDVQDSSFRLRMARRTLDLYNAELIPQAQARFNASEAGYRNGKLDFMDLLESERFLLDARIMAAMAEGTVGMQSARLERALGAGLEAGDMTRNERE